MIDNKRLLAIIPARGGSKRIPRKNVLDFSGKPLIAWTIESALGSKYIDQVIVSTDDTEIAQISKQYGADVPFMRPNEFSTDEAASKDVVLHVINNLKVIGQEFDYLILLQPTSPLRTSVHIDEAIEMLVLQQANNIVSVTRIEHPVEWTNTLPADYSLHGFISNRYKKCRSQDFPIRYRLNGAIYIVRTDTFLFEKEFILNDGAYAYEMLPQDSVDIDRPDDLDYARFLKDRR